jgi:hypothetical protein
MGDWELDPDPYYVHATHGATTVALEDDGGLTVEAEQGHGYMQQNITTRIPAEVVDWLIEQRSKRGERGTR